jgi:hypothetical protein
MEVATIRREIEQKIDVGRKNLPSHCRFLSERLKFLSIVHIWVFNSNNVPPKWVFCLNCPSLCS